MLSEQIRRLVANARTEDALNLLAKYHRDGIQLLAQFNDAKRQHGLGILGNDDWFRMQNKLNQSILELAEQLDAAVIIQPTVVVWLSDDPIPKNPKGKVRYIFSQLAQAVEDEEVTKERLQRVVTVLSQHFESELTQGLQDLLHNLDAPSFSRHNPARQQQILIEFANDILSLEEEFKKFAAELTTISRGETAAQAWARFQQAPTIETWQETRPILQAEFDTARNRHLFPDFKAQSIELDQIKSELLWKVKTEKIRQGLHLLVQGLV